MNKPHFRVDVEMRLDKLDAAIHSVSKATGDELKKVVQLAAWTFANAAGKEMPPNEGKLGIPVKMRHRRTWQEKAITFAAGTHTRGRVYGVAFVRDGKKVRRYYRKKAIQQSKKKIKNRGLAKEQFWAAMRLIDTVRGAPKSAWSSPGAKLVAAANVHVTKGRDLLYPFYHVVSNVEAAGGYRPYAEVKGLRIAGTRLRSMARRISKQQQKAWKK